MFSWLYFPGSSPSRELLPALLCPVAGARPAVLGEEACRHGDGLCCRFTGGLHLAPLPVSPSHTSPAQPELGIDKDLQGN